MFVHFLHGVVWWAAKVKFDGAQAFHLCFEHWYFVETTTTKNLYISKVIVLVYFLSLWQAAWPQEVWKRKGFIWPVSLSLRKAELETEGRRLKKTLQRDSVYWLSPSKLFCSHSYTAQAVLRMALPTVSWAPLHQSAIEKVPHRNGHRPIWLKQFFSWDFLFPNDYRSCQFLIFFTTIAVCRFYAFNSFNCQLDPT